SGRPIRSRNTSIFCSRRPMSRGIRADRSSTGSTESSRVSQRRRSEGAKVFARTAPGIPAVTTERGGIVADRLQRAKGASKSAAGKAKKETGEVTGRPGTAAKGAGKEAKGKIENAAGKARSAAKKRSEEHTSEL